MTEQELTELLRIAYQWGRDYGANRSDKNFNDLLQTEAISQALRTPDVSKSFCRVCGNEHINSNTKEQFCLNCGHGWQTVL